MRLVHLKKQILFTGLALFLILSSCKKGEDDPALSLSSRKARLAGEWKMQSGHLAYGDKSGGRTSASYTYDFDGKNYTLVTGKGGHFTGPATLQLAFTKKGTFSLEQKLDTLSFSGGGVWDFMGKVGKYKNKERVTLRLDNVRGDSDYYILFNKGVYLLNYRIKELRANKIVLVADEEYVSLNQGGDGLYVTAEYTFIN